jgi:DNA repair protein RadC
MEAIKSLPPMERPREKLRYQGAGSLSDTELLAVLLGSGNKGTPVSVICEQLVKSGLSQLDIENLLKIKGIGEAKAVLLLAAVELGSRLNKPERVLLKNDTDIYYLLRPVFQTMTELQYVLVLMTDERELLAIVEGRALLPEVSWVTGMAFEAGAKTLMLARNGWMKFSNAECKHVMQLREAGNLMGLVVLGMLAVGNDQFKIL